MDFPQGCSTLCGIRGESWARQVRAEQRRGRESASPISGILTFGAATEMEVAVTAFAPLLELLEAVPDPRRAEGKGAPRRRLHAV